MADRLPGMPLAPSDVFVCIIDDGAPRLVVPEPPALRVVRPGIWLVRAYCRTCTAHRYCSEHDARNWWLTHWGS